MESSCLAWLSDLIEARLAAQIDGLASILEPARASARIEHLREWPHDHGGADAAANLAADERAKEEVSRIYLDTLQWAADLIDDRLDPGPVLCGRFRRFDASDHEQCSRCVRWSPKA